MSLVNFYKIVCNDSGLIYVGSTCWTIEKRLQKHEYNYRCYLKNKKYFITSYNVFEKNNYTIQLIECVECVDRKQRNSIELLHILNENSVNRNQPGRDIKQYKIDNKEKLNEQSKQYQRDNKEQIDRKRNEKFTCPCGGKYTLKHKSTHMKSNKHINYLATL